MSESIKRTRIKICGMTSTDDVRLAVELGVDAIGMIMHADSPRVIDVERAMALRNEVPAFVTLVGVFVNCAASAINTIADQVGLDLVQLHGDESNDVGCALNRPFIKAVRARSSEQVQHDLTAFPDARAVLLDPYVQGQHGGTGKTLDSSLWPKVTAHQMILAGGLSPSNVAAAITELRPFAVDLNSGLESRPGVKDHRLMAQAVSAVYR